MNIDNLHRMRFMEDDYTVHTGTILGAEGMDSEIKDRFGS